MLKIVVLAAIPNANVTIATNVNPGDFRSVRNPNRMSCKKSFIWFVLCRIPMPAI
jgi:hypothetical protein